MAFNRSDLIGWARQLVEAQNILDEGARAKQDLITTRQQIEATQQKLAAMQDEHNQAAADLAIAKAAHQRQMDEMTAERRATEAGVEADKVARAVSHTAGLEQIRLDHAKARNDLAAEVSSLRREQEAARDELARLRAFKADLLRDIDTIAAKFGVPAK